MSHHSPAYSLTIRLRYLDMAGTLGQITSAIGSVEGHIGAVDIVDTRGRHIVRDFTVDAIDVEHGERIVEALRKLHDVEVLTVSDRTFLMHLGGKIEITSRVAVKTRDDLSMAYTPGVARVCQRIHDQPESVFALTMRRNMVAVLTDGSAVLGLGNIGPEASLPVMEGKALLFKEFADVNAFPICIRAQSVDEIVNLAKAIEPTFGGINLEDISAPRCVEIEERLREEVEIPVFHDDQHGTAVVVLAALKNALRVVEKPIESLRVVINGAGAAGVAIARLLLSVGITNLVVCDSRGAISARRGDRLNPLKQWLVENSNPHNADGALADVVEGADVFVGVSAPNVLSAEAVSKMNDDAIVFALANPDPEITPRDALPHVRIMATGRSDYPNQINNVLCFPGLFRGLLDVRATGVNEAIKLAAAEAIAAVITPEELHPEFIIPSVFDRRVATAVAQAVSQAAIESGVARKHQLPPTAAKTTPG